MAEGGAPPPVAAVEEGPASGAVTDVVADEQPAAGFQPDPRCRPSYPKKPESCHFFLTRKGRYCNIRATDGSRWCGNHVPGAQQDGVGAKPRMPCPVDPSHTIYAHNLNAHVRVCTRSQDNNAMAAQPFYKANVNSGRSCSDTATTTEQLSSDDAHALLARVLALAEGRYARLFSTAMEDAVQQFITGPAAESVMARIAEYGWAHAQARHAIQQASLVSHLERRGLLDGETTVVELGAGRGSLGLAVKLAFPSARLLMVERAGVKHKADSVLRKLEKGGAAVGGFRRLRMDLRHLHVRGMGLPERGRVAFVGKHVCGVATDLSLRAVAAYLREAPSASAPQPVGVGIACCCYHVCLWDDYVGKEVWEEELGWGRAEFHVVNRCACWVSSCRDEQKREAEEGGDSAGAGQEGEEQQAADAVAAAAPEEEHTLPVEAEAEGGGGYGRGLSREEKLVIGTACKRLIDYGRLEYLRRTCGLVAEVVLYCEPAVSPENSCILAWTKQAPGE